MPKAGEDDLDGGIIDDPIEEAPEEDDGLEAVAEDGEGQEAEGEEEADGPELADVAAKPPSRGERRFQNLSRALKEQKERADRIERELQEARNQRQ